MAPKSKDGRARLGRNLATDLLAFRNALGMGTTEVGIIRDAVRAFIEIKIGADEDLRQRYEAERHRLHSAETQAIRLVRLKGEPTD